MHLCSSHVHTCVCAGSTAVSGKFGGDTPTVGNTYHAKQRQTWIPVLGGATVSAPDLRGEAQEPVLQQLLADSTRLAGCGLG